MQNKQIYNLFRPAGCPTKHDSSDTTKGRLLKLVLRINAANYLIYQRRPLHSRSNVKFSGTAMYIITFSPYSLNCLYSYYIQSWGKIVFLNGFNIFIFGLMYKMSWSSSFFSKSLIPTPTTFEFYCWKVLYWILENLRPIVCQWFISSFIYNWIPRWNYLHFICKFRCHFSFEILWQTFTKNVFLKSWKLKTREN